MRKVIFCVAVSIAVVWSVNALAQTDSSSPPKPVQIDFVYMGGNDCPPCRAWRATEFRKLEAMPEYKLIRFWYVPKAIPSPVPSEFWFPSEIKSLRDAIFQASKGRGGSPQNAILVNGKLVHYWFGTSWGAEEIASVIRKAQVAPETPTTEPLKVTKSE